ncbi:MAG: Hpt domain-containing protein [Oligoflexia bacterium]|nr:Hpt domain-containing protein [Oligoflexia bacterium]
MQIQMQIKNLRRKNLRTKLISHQLLFLFMVFVSLGILFFLGTNRLSDKFLDLNNEKSKQTKESINSFSSQTIERIRTIYTTALENKAQKLINKDADSIKRMFKDNALLEIRSFLKESVLNDNDVISTNFFSIEDNKVKGWQLINENYQNGLDFPIVFKSESEEWIGTYNNGEVKVKILDNYIKKIINSETPTVEIREIKFFDVKTRQNKKRLVYECYTPIGLEDFSGKKIDLKTAKRLGIAVGFLRYVLSMDKMEAAIAREKESMYKHLDEINRQDSNASFKTKEIGRNTLNNVFIMFIILAIIIFTIIYFMIHSFSNKITIPISQLTKIAQKMTNGEYQQEFSIGADDEIGILAESFEEMSLAIIKRDQKLLEYNQQLESMVQQRTVELQQKNADIQNMLENLPQGVLTLLKHGIIHTEYSKYLELILECQDIANKKIIDVIFSKGDYSNNFISIIQSVLDFSIDEPYINYLLNVNNLPTEINYVTKEGNIKILELTWAPIISKRDNKNAVIEDIVVKILLSVRDVTLIKELTAKTVTQKKELDILDQILSVSYKNFQDFLQTAHQYINTNKQIVASFEETKIGKDIKDVNDVMKESLNTLFRNMHTIKGNARIYNLQYIANNAHEVEQNYAQIIKGSECLDKQLLLNNLEKLSSTINEYQSVFDEKISSFVAKDGITIDSSIYKQIVNLTDFLIDSTTSQGMNQDKCYITYLRQLVQTTDFVSLINATKGIVEGLSSTAQELNKRPPKVIFEENNIKLSLDIISHIKNILVHLMRNSIDHGIESDEFRKKNNKDIIGIIKITLESDSNHLNIYYSDDGSGLDLNKIIKIAKEQHLISEDSTPSIEEAANFIFEPEFTTKKSTTLTSGRGVGMDAVKKILSSIESTIQIKFHKDVYENVSGLLKQPLNEKEMMPFYFLITIPIKYAICLPTLDQLTKNLIKKSA